MPTTTPDIARRARGRAAMALAGAGALLLLGAPARGDGGARAATGADRDAMATTLRHAELVVLATALDPISRQDAIAVPAGPAFVRLRWRLRVERTLCRRDGAAAPVSGDLLVDEHDWRGDLDAWRHCKGDAGCADRRKPGHDTALTRPPRPGQAVVALLRRTADGWQLARDRALDHHDRAATARALCRASAATPPRQR